MYIIIDYILYNICVCVRYLDNVEFHRIFYVLEVWSVLEAKIKTQLITTRT